MSIKTLKAQSYDVIKNNIVSCKYTPGSIITEELLQEELNVSRTPIREAINYLEQEGLVEVLSKKGIMVSDISLEKICMLFETRLLIQPYVIKEYGNCISYDTYLLYFNAFNSLLLDINKQEYLDLDNSFYSLFFDASKNSYLINLYYRTCTQLNRLRIFTQSVGQANLLQATQNHIGIVEACLQKDWDKAAYYCTEHLKYIQQSYFKLLLEIKNNT